MKHYTRTVFHGNVFTHFYLYLVPMFQKKKHQSIREHRGFSYCWLEVPHSGKTLHLELISPTCQKPCHNLPLFTPPDVRSFPKQFEVREENTQVCVMSTTESNWRLAWNLIPPPTHSCAHYNRSLKEQHTRAGSFWKTSCISWDVFFSRLFKSISAA